MTPADRAKPRPMLKEGDVQMSELQELIAALAERSRHTTYAGNPRQYVDSVINNLDEVDAILPDSLNRPLIERIRLLLERADRESRLAVELRQRLEVVCGGTTK